MKDSIYKALIFILTFIIALAVFSRLLNQGATDMTVKMEEATLPTVSVLFLDQEINLMHGLIGNMEANMLRDSISPLSPDRSMKIRIHTYGQRPIAISYEVRSADAGRLVEDTEVTDYEENGDTIDATLRIKDLIKKEQEYILAVVLTQDSGRRCRYYTRIIWEDGLHIENLYRFMTDFSDSSFNPDEANSLSKYLESDASGDNSSYAHVNIHSSLSQVTWGSLNMEAPEIRYPSILEIDGNMATFRNRYTLKRGSRPDTVWYDVEEYYRLRYTNERIYLLNFDRYMREVFNPEDKDSFANDKVILGITDDDLDVVENEDGRVVAFVQNGSLYAWRNTDSRAVRVFSFFQNGGEEERNRFGDHDIRILQVDEGGNIHFIVYGYMNRGRHEGNIGVSVYYYNSALNQIEEELYIPYSRSYSYLRCEVEKLFYTTGGTELFLYLNGQILEVSPAAQTASLISDNVGWDSFKVSGSRRMAAWQTVDGKSLTLADFSNGKTRTIRGADGSVLRPLAFVGEDFVYGAMRPEDILESDLGITLYPMHAIYISDSNGNIIKTYEKDNIFVTDVSVKGNTLNLSRIEMTEAGSFISIEDEQIVNNSPDTADKNVLVQVVTEEFEKIVEIDLAGHIRSGTVHVATPEEVLFEGGRELELPKRPNLESLLMVYSEGDVKGLFNKAQGAVALAENISGAVVNDSQDYIWRRGDRSQSMTIDKINAEKADEWRSPLAVALDSILTYEGVAADSAASLASGQNALEILDERLGEGKALDLSGCPLSSVLYYVSKKQPVIAETDPGTMFLIIGYDPQNVVVMDPATGTIYKKGMNDAGILFASHGNQFISYRATTQNTPRI